MAAPPINFVLSQRAAVNDEGAAPEAVPNPETKGKQTASDLLNDVLHFAVKRVEFGSPLQRVGNHVLLTGVDEMPAVRIIVRGTGGRVEVEARFDRVVRAAECLNAIVETVSEAEGIR